MTTTALRTLAPVLLAALLLPAPAPGAAPASPPPGPAVAAHDLDISLDPATGGLEGRDRMTVVRNGGGNLSLDLRTELALRLVEVDGKPLPSLAREEKDPWPGVARYRVPVLPGSAPAAVTVSWGGVIQEKVRKAEDLAFVVGDHSRGTISPEGTFLSEGSAWVPLDGSMATFAVRASIPEGWTVATQGGVPTESTADGRTVFTYPAGIPCDGLWLQAGKWKVERRALPSGVSIATYLTEGNAGSSKLMLDSVEEYLGLYEKVLGPYPHAKFDIVENFFTTGYGMPTATLLGGDVIQHMCMMAQRAGGRIPPGYIDHELVHCWWGNGVFVDYDHGNWCEALTSYCSNYLRKEWESPAEGAKHRRGTRARFAARVTRAKDYPVRRFTGKTEDIDNDVGYGKGSMIFHRLRRAAGDEAFFGGLQDVVKEFTGKRATWDDFRRAFEKRSGRKLEGVMNPLLDRTGAPVLVLEGAAAKADADGWQVTGTIVQQGLPWSLAVPLVVETASGNETTTVDVSQERTPFSLRTGAVPLRVLLDPESECWRGFAPGEAPAMLDSALHDAAGLECMTAPSPLGDGYGVVEEAVRQRGARVCVMTESGFEPAPSPAGECSVLALGHLEDGDMLRRILSLARPSIRIEGKRLTVAGRRFEGDDIALLASMRHPANPERTITVYGGMSDAALAGARRVFFYGGDGIVVFKAGRPVLRLEPEGDASSRATLLDSLMPEADPARAGALVGTLTADEVEGRLAGAVEGAKARKALAKEMRDLGLEVTVQEFSFTAATWDGTPSCDGPEKGARPMTFSGRADEPVAVDPAGGIPVDAETRAEDLLAAVKAAVEKGAKSILVFGPPDVPKGIADYVFALPRETPEGAPSPDRDLVQAGPQARAPLPVEPLSIPAVYYPKPPERSALPVTVRAAVGSRKVAGANLLAVIPGSDPALAGEAILLGAHYDHLGRGFPGANDDASGVAAVLEAARVLSVHRAALRRPVVIALFDAEEWGLRGSRAFAAGRPDGIPPVAAALTLDTVGQEGIREVNVVGESVYPSLAAVMGRALAGAGLERGPDIDRFAFAHGSDHYALHESGIPSIDLFSTEYRLMHTAGDEAKTVDAAKLASLARAGAAWVLSLSRDGLPPKETR